MPYSLRDLQIIRVSVIPRIPLADRETPYLYDGTPYIVKGFYVPLYDDIIMYK
jgi:hypothetical protein